ncbi:hypothetical protein ACJ2A9_10720 [Anaerobacillus sp. MEB173]|uniref:hypothetical protein n=1 Tax=Anaerobacillus sp. MEB173 TaxID=3383345 RepID=UPI003F8EF736
MNKHTSKPRIKNCWKSEIQNSVMKIINIYTNIPVTKRSPFILLSLIEKCWNKQDSIYESKVHYYVTLAAVTNYLLQYVMKIDEGYYQESRVVGMQHSFLYNKRKSGGYTILTAAVDDNPEILQALVEQILVESEKVYGELPHNIEIYSLLTGKSIFFYPKICSVC